MSVPVALGTWGQKPVAFICNGGFDPLAGLVDLFMNLMDLWILLGICLDPLGADLFALWWNTGSSYNILDLMSYWEESSISLDFSRMSWILLNSAIIPLHRTSFCREGLKADNSHLLNEYLSEYWTIWPAYFVSSWINSWTVLLPCFMVLNLFDACYVSMCSRIAFEILQTLILNTNFWLVCHVFQHSPCTTQGNCLWV